MNQVTGSIELDFTAGPTPGTLAVALTVTGETGTVLVSEEAAPVKVGDRLSYGPISLGYSLSSASTHGKTPAKGAHPPAKPAAAAGAK